VNFPKIIGLSGLTAMLAVPIVVFATDKHVCNYDFHGHFFEKYGSIPQSAEIQGFATIIVDFDLDASPSDHQTLYLSNEPNYYEPPGPIPQEVFLHIRELGSVEISAAFEPQSVGVIDQTEFGELDAIYFNAIGDGSRTIGGVRQVMAQIAFTDASSKLSSAEFPLEDDQWLTLGDRHVYLSDPQNSLSMIPAILLTEFSGLCQPIG